MDGGTNTNAKYALMSHPIKCFANSLRNRSIKTVIIIDQYSKNEK